MAIKIEGPDGKVITVNNSWEDRVEVNEEKDEVNEDVEDVSSVEDENTSNDVETDDQVNDNEVEGDDIEAEDEEQTDENDDKPEEQKEPVKQDGFQKRVNKLNKRNEESVRKILELQNQVEQLSTYIEKMYETNDDLVEPDFNEYDDDEKYRQDYEAFKAKRLVKEELKKEKVQEAYEKMKNAYNARYITALEEASSRYEAKEYEEAMGNQDIWFNEFVSAEIVKSELPGDIIYYLNKNKDELDKLKKMKLDTDRVKYIHKLEAKLELQLENSEVTSVKKNVAKVSKAPPPVQTIKTKVGENGVNVRRADKPIPYSEYKRLRESGKIK